MKLLLKDLFGWFTKTTTDRVPLADGTLPFRFKGGPYDGQILYVSAGVNETCAFATRDWRGSYAKATTHTFKWKGN